MFLLNSSIIVLTCPIIVSKTKPNIFLSFHILSYLLTCYHHHRQKKTRAMSGYTGCAAGGQLYIQSVEWVVVVVQTGRQSLLPVARVRQVRLGKRRQWGFFACF